MKAIWQTNLAISEFSSPMDKSIGYQI